MIVKKDVWGQILKSIPIQELFSTEKITVVALPTALC